MAESKSESKTLEMRVAELEDKLSKVHITEEEMKAYHKVSALMGGAAAGATPHIPQVCVINRCIIYRCIINPVCVCINECSCGPCIAQGSGGTGGGFGSLGS